MTFTNWTYSCRSNGDTVTIDDCRIIELPKISDPRGNLTFIEGNRNIPFAMKRAYWIYDVPGGEIRGGHSYKTLQELIIAVSGSFDVVVDDARNKRVFSLNRSEEHTSELQSLR